MLRGSALCAAAAAGPALVPGPPSHPHLLPGQRRMEVPEDLRQNHRQRFTVRGFVVFVFFIAAAFCTGHEGAFHPDDCRFHFLTEEKRVKGTFYTKVITRATAKSGTFYIRQRSFFPKLVKKPGEFIFIYIYFTAFDILL